jgi:hypothetical protein
MPILVWWGKLNPGMFQKGAAVVGRSLCLRGIQCEAVRAIQAVFAKCLPRLVEHMMILWGFSGVRYRLSNNEKLPNKSLCSTQDFRD